VAPGASIWMAKVCDASGSCYSSDIAAAIQYVVNNHIAKVMSISLGGGGTSGANCDGDYLASQINWAFANGVVAVIAAGNSGSPIVGSPACASKAIAVAAVDSSDNVAYFSSYGNALKDHGVAAPGVNIYSTVPTGSCPLCSSTGYAYLSGTSMATPHVSATVALMLSKNPSLTPADIRSIILNAADCLNNKYGTCPNTKIGYGRVDALKSVSPYLSLSASPSTINTAQSSTITASTSDKFDTTITFTTTLGTLSAQSCATTGGSCSVTLTSTTAGTATITGSADGYASGSTSVKVTQAPVLYSATFSETGLPTSTTWGVTVGGRRYTSTNSIISVSELSGTVSYRYDSSITVGRTRYTCSAGCSGSVTSTSNNKAATYRRR
jgi:subtilisin family serine protease